MVLWHLSFYKENKWKLDEYFKPDTNEFQTNMWKILLGKVCWVKCRKYWRKCELGIRNEFFKKIKEHNPLKKKQINLTPQGNILHRQSLKTTQGLGEVFSVYMVAYYPE